MGPERAAIVPARGQQRQTQPQQQGKCMEAHAAPSTLPENGDEVRTSSRGAGFVLRRSSHRVTRPCVDLRCESSLRDAPGWVARKILYLRRAQHLFVKQQIYTAWRTKARRLPEITEAKSKRFCKLKERIRQERKKDRTNKNHKHSLKKLKAKGIFISMMPTEQKEQKRLRNHPGRSVTQTMDQTSLESPKNRGRPRI